MLGPWPVLGIHLGGNGGHVRGLRLLSSTHQKPGSRGAKPWIMDWKLIEKGAKPHNMETNKLTEIDWA